MRRCMFVSMFRLPLSSLHSFYRLSYRTIVSQRTREEDQWNQRRIGRRKNKLRTLLPQTRIKRRKACMQNDSEHNLEIALILTAQTLLEKMHTSLQSIDPLQINKLINYPCIDLTTTEILLDDINLSSRNSKLTYSCRQKVIPNR